MREPLLLDSPLAENSEELELKQENEFSELPQSMTIGDLIRPTPRVQAFLEKIGLTPEDLAKYPLN